MNIIRKFLPIATGAVIFAMLAGCQSLPTITAAAGSLIGAPDQGTELGKYIYRVEADYDQAYSAALLSASGMGRVNFQDRAAGMIQFQKGNWVINAALLRSGPQTFVGMTFQYFPSANFDFNSKTAMAEAFTGGISKTGLNVVSTKEESFAKKV